jgi:hypothetical protein
MKRRGFIKSLAFTGLVVSINPFSLIEVPEKIDFNKTLSQWKNAQFKFSREDLKMISEKMMEDIKKTAPVDTGKMADHYRQVQWSGIKNT